jgi:hypothetical protein
MPHDPILEDVIDETEWPEFSPSTHNFDLRI